MLHTYYIVLECNISAPGPKAQEAYWKRLVVSLLKLPSSQEFLANVLGQYVRLMKITVSLP